MKNKILSSFIKLKFCLVLFRVKQVSNTASQAQKRTVERNSVLLTPNLEQN